MLTMNQVGTLVNSTGLIIIFGFIFCMIRMIMGHIFRMKVLAAYSIKSEHDVLRRQLTMGLSFLLFCFLGALMLMGFIQSWGGSGYEIPFTSHPNWQRQVTNEVINVIRLLVIFSFVGGGIKMILRYREQIAKLKNSNQEANNMKGVN